MILDNRPIGIFDSGIGGFSILNALIKKMPNERFVYLSDASFSPYGEKDASDIQQRSCLIFDYLLNFHNVKAVVVACNTATAVAIDFLRSIYTTIPIVGVEPAIKPASKITKTGLIGVIGTRNTLSSLRFATLKESIALSTNVNFIVQSCDGLATAIEEIYSQHDFDESLLLDFSASVYQTSHRYLSAMGIFGLDVNNIDTLVLGCTHYIFALPAIKKIVGDNVMIVENGAPVSEQVFRVLNSAISSVSSKNSGVVICTTGDLDDVRLVAENMFQATNKTYHYIRL